MAALLEVDRLVTSRIGGPALVDGVSFSLEPGKMLGLVGESGCGKSLTALSIMGLLPSGLERTSGQTRLLGKPITAADRGKQLAMVFQEPAAALNPVLPIGAQISETLQVHLKLDRRAARVRAIELMRAVGIADAAERFDAWPHQLSGGMRQRVLIAAAIACDPKVLIADEPTTALDVTIQAQILDILRELSSRLGLSTIMITHNLGVIAEFAERVIVMYTGKVREEAPVVELFKNPLHPYTQGLLHSMPKLGQSEHKRLPTIEGMVPDLLHLPTGCSFYDRCPKRMDHCKTAEPPLLEVSPGHKVACYLYSAPPAG